MGGPGLNGRIDDISYVRSPNMDGFISTQSLMAQQQNALGSQAVAMNHFIPTNGTETRIGWYDSLGNKSVSVIKDDKKKEGYMNYLKEYLVKHRELLFSIAVVLVVDHYVFKGKFSARIHSMVDSFLGTVEQKLKLGGTDAGQ